MEIYGFVQSVCVHVYTKSRGITVSSLYLITVELIFPQEGTCLLRTTLIRVKGFCLLLLNIPKYYSIYRVIYMLMLRLVLHTHLTLRWAVRLGLEKKIIVRKQIWRN